MKKIISLVLVLIVATTLLVGCDLGTDVDDMVLRLKSKGFGSSASYVEPKDLERATSFANSEVKSMGGDFAVEVVEQYNLTSNSDPTKTCTFIVFATAKQARLYTNRKINHFAKLKQNSQNYGDYDYGNIINGKPSQNNTFNWKVARSGCLVVITNSDTAMDTIHLHFK